MDHDTVAKQFTNFYYDTFDRNRADLQPLYRPESMLTFEGSPIQGVNGIIEKLTSLPFQRVRHQISTIDAQPSSPNGTSIVVSITGLLLIDDETNPQMFTQTFKLIAEGQSYWVLNDIFRLNYGI